LLNAPFRIGLIKIGQPLKSIGEFLNLFLRQLAPVMCRHACDAGRRPRNAVFTTLMSVVG
jgi:hypothetical protein